MNPMKKLLLASALVGCLGLLNAQTTFLNEDFESGSMPGSWTQVTLATDGGWLVGNNTTLQSQYWPIPAHTVMAATNDDGCDCDKSNDLLKTASLNLSTAAMVHLATDIYFIEG